jgi:outer membrane protein assembly factor BamB
MTRFLPPVLFVFSLVLAQPQGQVLWSQHGTDGIYSTTAIRDVNGDTRPEVVGAIYYANYPSDPRKVYCLSGASGDTIWISRESYGTWGNKGIDWSADLNADGIEDIILGTAGTYIPPGRSCIAIDGATGANLWVFPFGEERGWCYTVKAFRMADGTPVDIDGDSVPEVLASAGGITNDRRGTAIALSGRTGDSLWAFRPSYDGAQCIAPFDDVDADSVPDVVVGAGGNGYDNRVFCLSGRNGDSLWAFETDNSVQDVEMIRDVNASGFSDCLAGGWADSVFCLEGQDGSLIWACDIGTVVMEIVPCGDLDRDSVMDIVVGSWSSSVYVLSGADGSIIWAGSVGADVWAVDTLADVTMDGIPEVAAGCLGGGTGVARVFDGAKGDVLWSYTFNERVYDLTGIPDVNRDGLADLAVGLQDHGNQADHFYCFSGLPGSGVVSERTSDMYPETSIRFCPQDRTLLLDVPEGHRYQLRLYDAIGRQVGRTVRGVGSDTTGRLRLDDIASLASGTYFADLVLEDGRSASVKLIRLSSNKR